MKRPWLLPLSPLYALGVAWTSRRYTRNPKLTKTLEQPVISVGNLSAGGAGKTPFLIALGEALRRAGYGIDVLSRGHGRTSSLSLRVRPGGNVNDFGDEPLLIAQRLACPVYVARERLQAGRMAETDRRIAREDRRPSVHLLDDGFQHRQLARAVDIVLLTAEDADDTLLPAGNLREPLSALRRAQIIVLRREEQAALRPTLERVFAASEMPPLWIIERHFAFVEGKPSLRPLAFCGIARPDSFLASLMAQGVAPASFLPLQDHQRYDDALIIKLIARATAAQADGFVTTAKDAVKLTDAMRRTLANTGPLAVSDVSVTLQGEARCTAELLPMLEAFPTRPRKQAGR